MKFENYLISEATFMAKHSDQVFGQRHFNGFKNIVQLLTA